MPDSRAKRSPSNSHRAIGASTWTPTNSRKGRRKIPGHIGGRELAASTELPCNHDSGRHRDDCSPAGHHDRLASAQRAIAELMPSLGDSTAAEQVNRPQGMNAPRRRQRTMQREHRCPMRVDLSQTLEVTGVRAMGDPSYRMPNRRAFVRQSGMSRFASLDPRQIACECDLLRLPRALRET